MTTKLTDKKRQEELYALYNRLDDAIGKTARGITDAEIWTAIKTVCHDLGIKDG